MTESHIIHFVDTETTGLLDKYPDSEIIELAIVKWQDGDTETVLHAYIQPKKPCPPEAAKINRYTPARWKAEGAETWDIACSKEVSAMLKGAFMGGSNPAFDQQMLKVECFRTGQPMPDWSHRKLDTSALGYILWVYDLVPRTGLVTLAEYFGIEHDAHTALGDCLASIKVWESFCELFMYRPRMMREALEAIERNVDKAPLSAAKNVLVPIIESGLRGEG